LRATVEAGKVRLTGRFGVFAKGRLALLFLDGQKKVLAKKDLAKAVSPLGPVIIDDMAKLPVGTESIHLVFVNTKGQESGELAAVAVGSKS